MSSYLIMTGCDHGAAYAECDQIADTLTIAKREVIDLVHIGCGQIRVYEFADNGAAQDYVDEKGARWPSKTAAKLLMTKASRD